jgi:hypothetical protein
VHPCRAVLLAVRVLVLRRHLRLDKLTRERDGLREERRGQELRLVLQHRHELQQLLRGHGHLLAHALRRPLAAP